MPAAYVLIIVATVGAFVPVVLVSIRSHLTLIAAIESRQPAQPTSPPAIAVQCHGQHMVA